MAIGVVVAALSVLSPAAASADDGRLSVDGSGSNGAVIGQLQDSRPGFATITIRNTNEFWTTTDISVTGVALTPGPPLGGGVYAQLGLIAPGETAVWTATWNPRQAAQVFVRTTPYIDQTDAGPLAAGLTILTIVTDVLTEIYPQVGRVVARAEALTEAVALIEPLFGDLNATVSIEGLTSGAVDEALWNLLEDDQKVEVLREALGLFRVTASTDRLRQLNGWIPVVKLSYRTLLLASALLTGTSSGGVLFDSDGTAALPATSIVPTSITPTQLPGQGQVPTTPPRLSTTATPTTSPPPSVAMPRDRTITVPAGQPWTDTGIDIVAGEHLYIVGSGVITIAGSDPGKYTNGDTVGASPAGYCSAAKTFTAPGRQCFGMVARISTGPPFDVLASVSWTADSSGRLFIGVNDDEFGDNAGSWQASVRVCQGRSLGECVTAS